MMELSIEQINRIYNIGYNSGHDDTVEGRDVPASHSDMDDHQRDIVVEILVDI